MKGKVAWLPGKADFIEKVRAKRMKDIFTMTIIDRSSPSCWWSRSNPYGQEYKCIQIASHFNSTQSIKYGCKFVGASRLTNGSISGVAVKNYDSMQGRRLQKVSAMTISSEEKAMPVTEEYKVDSNKQLEDIGDKYFGKPTDRSELEALRTDSMRTNLVRKLSESNQYNRHLKRQLDAKEKALKKCKAELVMMELEFQALVELAEEVAKSSPKEGIRKINGRYLHSHLQLRLEELHKKLLEQIKDVQAMEFREVPLLWIGMAEDVKVMGSFDGWSQGEQMSPEHTGSFTKFSTTLKLRPGCYEVKFLVDGEWHLSPQLPVVGDGLSANNFLEIK